MVRMLFECIEYDLDTRRITNFRLKPWADNFLVLRAAWYEIESPQNDEGGKDGKRTGDGTKFMVTSMPQRDSGSPQYPTVLLDPQTCARELLRQLYKRFPPTPPINKQSRNTELYQRYLQGIAIEELLT